MINININFTADEWLALTDEEQAALVALAGSVQVKPAARMVRTAEGGKGGGGLDRKNDEFRAQHGLTDVRAPRCNSTERDLRQQIVAGGKMLKAYEWARLDLRRAALLEYGFDILTEYDWEGGESEVVTDDESFELPDDTHV